MSDQMSSENPGSGINPLFLADLRDDMLRFAHLELGSDEAEDAVQEALAGALKNAAGFRREAALKSWVIAILKNKIADILRQRRRRPSVASDLTADGQETPLPDVFDRKGMWHDATKPTRWGNPEADLHERQFLTVFDTCLNRLPPSQGRVFMMREVVELEAAEICAELGLSSNNLYVILHRARLGLRACLERNWLHQDEER